VEPLASEQQVEQESKHDGEQCVERILEVGAWEAVVTVVPSEDVCDDVSRVSLRSVYTVVGVVVEGKGD
jgi:hypothetical protein